MYIVVDTTRGFLGLNGPFAYPVWLSSASEATRLTWGQANAYAHAYGGEVRGAS